MSYGPRTFMLDSVVAFAERGGDACFVNGLDFEASNNMRGNNERSLDTPVIGYQPPLSCFWLLPPFPVDAWLAAAWFAFGEARYKL